MKFKLDIEKKKRGDIKKAKGHNLREHATESQLREAAWLTPQGHHVIKSWRQEVMDKALGLAKRKDAVVAIEMIFQVGKQGDWREPPSVDFPEGKPIPLDQANARLRKLTRGVSQAIEDEFGADNIVGIDLHTDESTPHVHVIVTPIHEGKLQAKHWLDGVSRCAALRERVHTELNKHLPCEYTKGASNRQPHDPSKAAGQENGPQPSLSWLKRKTDKAAALAEENRGLKQRIEAMAHKFTKKLKQWIDRVNELIEQVNELKAEVAKLQDENKSLKDQIKNANLDLSAERRDKAKLLNLNGGLKADIERLEDKMAAQRQQQSLRDLARRAGGPSLGR